MVVLNIPSIKPVSGAIKSAECGKAMRRDIYEHMTYFERSTCRAFDQLSVEDVDYRGEDPMGDYDQEKM